MNDDFTHERLNDKKNYSFSASSVNSSAHYRFNNFIYMTKGAKKQGNSLASVMTLRIALTQLTHVAKKDVTVLNLHFIYFISTFAKSCRIKHCPAMVSPMLKISDHKKVAEPLKILPFIY